MLRRFLRFLWGQAYGHALEGVNAERVAMRNRPVVSRTTAVSGQMRSPFMIDCGPDGRLTIGDFLPEGYAYKDDTGEPGKQARFVVTVEAFLP